MVSLAICDPGDLRDALSLTVDDPGQLAPTARLLASPVTLLWLIGALRADDRALGLAAAASQLHPLGFDKYVLHASETCELRLHVWWPSDLPLREDVHDHRFDFGSCLIAGALNVETFTIDDTGTAMDAYVEDHVPRTGAYRLRPAGRVRIRSYASMALRPESAYFTSSHVLHRVGNEATDDQVTMTLVVKRPHHQRSTTTVLVADGGVPPRLMCRSTLTPEQLRQRLGRAEEVLRTLA